jgi:hypothetical protein
MIRKIIEHKTISTDGVARQVTNYVIYFLGIQIYEYLDKGWV